MFSNLIIVLITLGMTIFSCNPPQDNPNNQSSIMSKDQEKGLDTLAVATLGAGCFWCVEAIFQELIGVKSVVSGYTGGHVDNPSYKAVCQGVTGHAEVAQIHFDPNKVSFEEILEVFWHVHDPTTLNRQGNDVGSQYRSAIYYHTPEQKAIAEKSKAATDKSGLWNNPIVTEITPIAEFYTAEQYHQDYFTLNPTQGYCSAVIAPKVAKFRKKFKDRLKSSL